jgi:hypothetical protein
MSNIISAFFNGTPMEFPYVTNRKQLFEFLDESISYYEDDVEFYYNQTIQMEKTMVEESINLIVTKKTHIKAAKKLGFKTIQELQIIWFCNIHYLLKKGKIKDDNNNGWWIMESDNKELITDVIKLINKQAVETMKQCGLCAKPAKQLCGKCKKIYYCCRDHQLSDWEKHKQICKRIY